IDQPSLREELGLEGLPSWHSPRSRFDARIRKLNRSSSQDLLPMIALRRLSLAGFALVASLSTATAQVVSETVDLSIVQKLKDQGMTRSKLDELALYLNDVIGARLTNSPASRKANAWAAEAFR